VLDPAVVRVIVRPSIISTRRSPIPRPRLNELGQRLSFVARRVERVHDYSAVETVVNSSDVDEVTRRRPNTRKDRPREAI